MCELAACEWSQRAGLGAQLDGLVSCAFVYEASNGLRVCIVWKCPEPQTDTVFI